MTKEEDALQLVSAAMALARNPISLCSFGKDSIVVLHLCMRFRKIPVICWRLAKFHEKHKQMHKVSMLWDLEVYDMWPVATFDYLHEDFFEVMHVYGTGHDNYGKRGIMAMATGVRPYDGESRFLCAKEDLLERPRIEKESWPWDVTFHGHKSVDDPEFGRTAKITKSYSTLGGTTLVCPLHDWTDQDVWDYIKKYDVPYDRERYDLGFKAESPDSYATCYRCRDPRQIGQEVWCPKYERSIPSDARPQEAMNADLTALLGSLTYCEVSGAPRTTPCLDHT